MTSSAKPAPPASPQKPKQIDLLATTPSSDEYGQCVEWLRAEAAKVASRRARASRELQRLQRELKYLPPGSATAAAFEAEIAKRERAVASHSAELARLNREALALFQGTRGSGGSAA